MNHLIKIALCASMTVILASCGANCQKPKTEGECCKHEQCSGKKDPCKGECKKDACKHECKGDCKKDACKGECKGDCKKDACKHKGCKHNCKEMKYSTPALQLSSEMPIVDVKPGIKRQIMCYNDDIMLVKVFFSQEMVGQRPPLHQHPHSQSSYVLSGKYELHIGDEVRILTAGDAYYAAPNVPHEAYVLEPGEVIDGFSPLREDFLK